MGIEIQKAAIKSVTCDVCGVDTWKECDFEYAHFCANWGYGSKQDGESIDMYLCEDCANTAMYFITQQKNI